MSSDYEQFSSQDGIDRLAEHRALQDGRITHVSVTAIGGSLNVRLTCIPRIDSAVAEAIIELRHVVRFELAWESEDSEFYFVPGYTALLRESGLVYLSLDPYDDQAERADERDCDVIEAREMLVSLRKKDADPR